MGLAIVTNGYLNVAILVIALYLAIKSGKVLPMPLDDKAETNPVVLLNIERLLATAMGWGLFVVAMIVWAEMFPATSAETLTAILP